MRISRYITECYALYIISFLLLVTVSCGEDRPARRLEQYKQDLRREEAESGDAYWPTFMHDISYRGVSPDKTLRQPLALLWKFKTGGPVISSPVVAGETVYVGSDDHRLYALHARKWGVIWEFEAGDRIITAPTVYSDYVYFSGRDNKVYALDASTGAKIWEFQADGWINAPVVAFRQKIYFGCYENKIYVLNAITGKLESQETSSIRIGRHEYICSQGEFYPMNSQYLAKRWREQVTDSESWPATANNVVYIGARDNKIHAFDANTRKAIWQFETDGWVDSSPAIANGVLYVGSNDGYIYAFVSSADLPPQPVNRSVKKEGVVTHDGTRVYGQTDNTAAVISRLNEGTSLPITSDEKGEWYEVLLPNGQTGWLSALDFIPVKWSEGLQVNDTIVKDVKKLNLPQRADNPSWSPDGSIVLFFEDVSMKGLYWKGGSIWLASSDGSNPRWVADGAFYNSRISWTDNGSAFVIENLARTQRQVWMARSNGTGLRKLAEGEAPAMSPNGDRVAFIRRGTAATSIWVLRLADGNARKLAEFPIKGSAIYTAYGYIADLNLPAWSSDSSLLAVGLDGYHYSDNHSRVAIIAAAGGVLREIGARAERIRDIAWSSYNGNIGYVTQEHPNRRVSGQLDKKVHLTNINMADREEVFEHSEGITWSPRGRYMAFVEENDCMGVRRKVWLLDLKTLQRAQLLASRENIQKISWLANGSIAITASIDPSKATSGTLGWIASIQSLPE